MECMGIEVERGGIHLEYGMNDMWGGQLPSREKFKMLNDHVVQRCLYISFVFWPSTQWALRALLPLDFFTTLVSSSWIELGEGHHSLKLEVLTNVQRNEEWQLCLLHLTTQICGDFLMWRWWGLSSVWGGDFLTSLFSKRHHYLEFNIP